MSARTELLAEVESLREAVDLPVLIDSTVDVRVRTKLIAGIAITAFITIEQFFRGRTTELAAFVSTGSTHFQDLAPVARKALLARTARNFLATMQRNQSMESDWIAAATSIGRSMTTVATSPLTIAPQSLEWPGSNLQESDIEEVLQILGCRDKAWESLTAVVKRGLREDSAIVLKGLFRLLAKSRHSAAHSAQFATTVTELRTLPRATLLLAFGTDCLASHLALELQRGRLAKMPQASQRVVRFRFVERRGNYWRHIAEGRVQGSRFPTRQDAFAAAMQVAGTQEETVVEVGPAGEPTTWLPAFCP